MTDGELLSVLRRIDSCNWKVAELIAKVAESGRLDAASIRDALLEQCLSCASAETVGGHYLGDRWSLGLDGHYRRRASRPSGG